jgi:hypothetical protein
VRDKPAFVCPACFNPTPLTEVVALSRFSSHTGGINFEEKRKEKVQKLIANIS